MSNLLTSLRNKGLCVTLRGDDGLSVKPLNLLTEGDKALIRQQKRGLVEALKALPADPAGPLLQRQGWTVRYVTDPAAARAVVGEFLALGDAPLGLDIETCGPSLRQGRVLFLGGLDPHLGQIRSVQVANEHRQVAVFDLALLDPELLRPLLQGPGRFIAYHAGFEYRFLQPQGLVPVRLDCAMLMARLVHGLVASGHAYPSLQATVHQVLGLAIDKAVRDSDWSVASPLSPPQIHYAALDAVLALQLAGPLEQALAETGQTRAYDLIRRALPVTQEVMLAGLRFDRERHARLAQEWATAAAAAKQDLGRAIPQIRNPNSAPQMAAWLENTLPPELKSHWPRTDTGNLQTGADALAEWPECPKALLRFKEYEKLSTTYGEAFADHIHPVTGRMHGEFALVGTRGGRFRCARPNLQNPPRLADFRQLFVPAKGYAFVVADFSQIELRVCAIVAEDTTMQQAYRDGIDLHRLTAATAAGIPLEQVTPEQRQAAKAINFGLIYGMSASTLVTYAWTSYRTRLTLEAAEGFRQTFFDLYRGVARWHRDVQRRGRQDATVTTRMGLRRDLAQEPKGWKFTNACNTPVQGSAAEVLLASLARLHVALQGWDARIVHHVHDEIVVECRADQTDRMKIILTECMTQGFLEIFPEYPELTRDLIEAKAGDNWYSAKQGDG